MKRLLVSSFIITVLLFPLILPLPSSAFDISGLKPVAPNGVFSTFSTESLRRKELAFEVNAEKSADPDFYRFTLSGAYGLTDSIELNLTVPYIYNFQNSYDGLEDIAFGLKHRFYDEGKYGPSLAYILSLSLGTGRDRLSTDGRLGLGFILSKRIKPFRGHLNLFLSKPVDNGLEDEVSLACGLEFSAAHNITLLGEIIAKNSHYSKEYDQIETRIGYRIRTSDYIYTTIGAGTDLKNRGPEYRLFISFSFAPFREKRQIKKIIEEE